MKVVFLSKFYPRQERDKYFALSKAGLAAAADAHQYALALGLKAVCNDFSIVNIPALYPFPTRYRKAWVKGDQIEENGLDIDNVGFCNILFINKLDSYKRGKRRLEKIIKETKDIVYILVYATSLPFLRMATELKAKYTHVRISIIIPDLPEDMMGKAPALDKLVNSILGFKTFEWYISQFDSYVLLTKYMQEKIGCRDDQFIVSEGVYDETTTPRSILSSTEKTDKFVIFYSGTMDRKFGVMNLVKAVCAIDDPSLELRLCGYGDALEQVKQMAKEDHRIVYLGIVSRDEALKEQSAASLLVNPRIPDNNPFTRYSFPSKTLEYLSSGVPTLLYKLDGIPEEYYDYCYALNPEQTSVEDLSSAILKIKQTSAQENEALGKKARNFILEEKNAIKAATQIFDFLNQTI